MNMPGFTAEASLYKTSGNYRMIGTFDSVEGSVQLAQGNCFRNCMEECVDEGLLPIQCLSICHHKCFGITRVSCIGT